MTPALAARLEAARLTVRPAAVPGEYEVHDRSGALCYSGTEDQIAYAFQVDEWMMAFDRRTADMSVAEMIEVYGRRAHGPRVSL